MCFHPFSPFHFLLANGREWLGEWDHFFLHLFFPPFSFAYLVVISRAESLYSAYAVPPVPERLIDFFFLFPVSFCFFPSFRPLLFFSVLVICMHKKLAQCLHHSGLIGVDVFFGACQSRYSPHLSLGLSPYALVVFLVSWGMGIFLEFGGCVFCML